MAPKPQRTKECTDGHLLRQTQANQWGLVTRTVPCFAVAAPGLEAAVAAELRAFGCESREIEGGAEFAVPIEALPALLPRLQCASRLLVRVAEGRVDTPAAVAALLAQVPWSVLPEAPARVVLRLSAHGAPPDRIRWLEAELLRGLAARFGAQRTSRGAASGEGTELAIAARLEARVCTLSLDAGGAPLHQRGYRLEAGPAPLRETLAAALLHAAGWQGQGTLWDPMCGSGTIAIEAARSAALRAGRPLPVTRGYAVDTWRIQAAPKLSAAPQLPVAANILAGDLDPGVLEIAQRNAVRAGVADLVTWQCAELAAQDVTAQGQGFVVTNPPYGQRLGGRNAMRRLVQRLGAVLARQCDGWKFAALLWERDLIDQLPLRDAEVREVDNGGLKLWLTAGELTSRPRLHARSRGAR